MNLLDPPQPYVIGITGGSGSGKTLLMQRLAEIFSVEEVCFVSQDNYYYPREQQLEDENQVKNFDRPDAIDHGALARDIRLLKSRTPVKRKEYTFNNPMATPREMLCQPAPVIVVEGLFVHYFPEIVRELDLKVFVEAQEHIMLARRIMRDQEQRGYDLKDVLYRYQHHVMPVYRAYIEHLKDQADLIIPNNGHLDNALQVLHAFIQLKCKPIGN